MKSLIFALCLVSTAALAQELTEQEVNEALIICSQAKSEAAGGHKRMDPALTAKCDKVEAMYRERVKAHQDRQKSVLDKIK